MGADGVLTWAAGVQSTSVGSLGETGDGGLFARGVRDPFALRLTLALGVRVSPVFRDVVCTLLASSAPSLLIFVRAILFSAVWTVQGATSPLNRVVVGLGGGRSGLVGVGAALGLIERAGASFDPLRHLFTLGLGSEVGECALFGLGAVLPVIGVIAGLVGIAGSLDGEDVGGMAAGLQCAVFADVVRMGSTIASPGTGLLGGMGV
jgi:hypothetical protein